MKDLIRKQYQNFVMLIMLLIIITLCIMYSSMSNSYKKQNDELIDMVNTLYNEIENTKEIDAKLYAKLSEDKDKQIEEANNNIKELITKNNELASRSNNAISIAEKMVEENNQLVDEMNNMKSTYEEGMSRIQKYEKYEPYLFDTAGRKNDITYEVLSNLEALIEDKVVNDPDLYLAWIMIESEGHNEDRNPRSTADGLPQFLEGTARWTYEDLMGNGKGTYTNHQKMIENPEISIPMMVAYVDYLIWANNGDLHKAINSYRGLYDAPYLAKFNRYLDKKDKSIESIATVCKQRYNKFKDDKTKAHG